MFSHSFSQVISRLDPPLQENPAPVLLCHDVPSVGLFFYDHSCDSIKKIFYKHFPDWMEKLSGGGGGVA